MVYSVAGRSFWDRFGPIWIVVYQLGVQSFVAVVILAVSIGFGFGFAGQGISPLDTSQILRLFVMLSSGSVGVLMTMLIFLIRAILPVSLIVHLKRGWPARRLGIGSVQLLIGSCISAPILFLGFQLFGLLSLAYASDGWLDFADLTTVLDLVQPVVVVESALRVTFYSALCVILVLSRTWPIMELPLDQAHRQTDVDAWLPRYRLYQGRLVLVYSDLFRLLLLVVGAEMAIQMVGSLFSALS
jgi:hypothetical protein